MPGAKADPLRSITSPWWATLLGGCQLCGFLSGCRDANSIVEHPSVRAFLCGIRRRLCPDTWETQSRHTWLRGLIILINLDAHSVQYGMQVGGHWLSRSPPPTQQSPSWSWGLALCGRLPRCSSNSAAQ